MAERGSWRSYQAKRLARSLFLMPKASSDTVATGRWFNLYDSRSNLFNSAVPSG